MAQKHLNASLSQPLVATAAEDQARASVYALLGALLRDVPTAHVLEQVRQLESATKRDAFALAWEGLRLAAQQVHPAELDDEYQLLFIGLGRGELVPYGSWYQTGFLMEQPLGVLRRDLKALGFERQTGVHEPEDHVAALCEVMSALALDPDTPIERQADFYAKHIGPWIERFCRDLETAEASVFYKAVGRLGDAFFTLERRYLEMGD
jgi:TorA maturation chaperone TorD